ncbi:MAG: hypothetical protein PHC28_00520 [Flavobacterium sp.]|uniref:hypothetical protein n=1 Tax=Flavobacterium sp. TaxID=239 RepID=UPI0026334216|nr:hypothetical protein [Flavobacterium sp.]MDD5148950.1 hypothetical protein [Flavobacterium sp.]
MKLSTQQIATIDETLVLNGLIYDDIKLEVTDHIASEIETKMKENKLSFEDALYKVLLNWKEQMKPSYSFWLGSKNVAPRIVIDKLILNSKQQQLKGVLIAFFIAVLLTIFSRNIDNEIVFTNMRMVLKTIFSLELLLLLVGKYLIWKSITTTSFGFFYKKLGFSIMLFLFYLAIGIMPMRFVNPDLVLNLVFNFFPSLYLVLPIYYLQLAYKHFQFEKKFKLY